MDSQGIRRFASSVNNHPVYVALTALAMALGLVVTIQALASWWNGRSHPEYVDVRVVRTCGAAGAGDCVVTVRDRPSPDAEPIQDLPEGSRFTVVCQLQGSSVKATELKRPTSVWSRTQRGGYVSNAYLEGIDVFRVTTPCAE